MAKTLGKAFEMLPVLKQLFKSEHFFDSVNNNVIIKAQLILCWDCTDPFFSIPRQR